MSLSVSVYLCSGLVLQDLTFVHIGNADRLADGCINFTKCWQMFNILDHMRRFGKWYVPILRQNTYTSTARPRVFLFSF